MSVPAFDFDAPRARRNAMADAGAHQRRAPQIDEAPPEGQEAAPQRKGIFGRIGDWFGGMRSRFRNWRLRNTPSAEGSEILTKAVDEMSATEGGYTYGEDDAAVRQRIARNGLLTEASGARRQNRGAFRQRPMKAGADPEAVKRFWNLDFTLNNLGRREDEPVVHSTRHVPRQGKASPTSEAGRATADFAGHQSNYGMGLGWKADMLGMRGTKEAALAARTGTPFNGLNFGDQSRVALGKAKRKYGFKDKGQVIPEAADESMEQDGAIGDDLASMDFDKDA